MNKKQLQDILAKMKAEKGTGTDKTELYKAYNAYLQEQSFDDFDEEEAASKIKQFDLQQFFFKSRTKTKQIRKWGISAAAAILIMFGLAYYSINNMDTSQQEPQHISLESETEIPKIRTEAVAILPNGKEIVLNNDGFNTVTDARVDNDSNPTEQYITLKTPRGGKLNFQLPDGSLVWLNSETTLTYPISFGKKSRNVELQGEAYFEVAKQKLNDQSISFIVDAGAQKIKVLGTKFNVNNYQNEDVKTTTLVEGVVEVHGNNSVSKLAPDQQFIQSKNVEKVVRVNVQDFIGWKEGIIRLSKQDFPAIARMIERNYNVKFDQEKLPTGFKLNGELLTNVNIDELLKGLGATMGVNFSRKGALIQIENDNITN